MALFPSDTVLPTTSSSVYELQDVLHLERGLPRARLFEGSRNERPVSNVVTGIYYVVLASILIFMSYATLAGESAARSSPNYDILGEHQNGDCNLQNGPIYGVFTDNPAAFIESAKARDLRINRRLRAGRDAQFEGPLLPNLDHPRIKWCAVRADFHLGKHRKSSKEAYLVWISASRIAEHLARGKGKSSADPAMPHK